MVNEVHKEKIERIGAKLKALRLKAGYTSYETFAVDHGFSRRNYWALEKGTNFKIESLLLLLDVHKLTLAEFFQDLE
ncbi:hypothetical protein [Aquimarina macrocephali]|uniref:hypothetical protein n=1 Tax=Aquimarina macrocephali TaxID=666563 RepID=UPI0004656F4A|nr:hypothetical protein [Aquimarina macrocephali]